LTRSDEYGPDTIHTKLSVEAYGETSFYLLVMIGNGMQEFQIPPSGGRLDIGRAAHCRVRINASSISREHARIIAEEDRICIQDLGSTNGTYVNGKRIGSDPVELLIGDGLRFGDVIAHVRGRAASRAFPPRVVAADRFEERLQEEGERCVRHGRSMAAVSVSVADVDATLAAKARAAVLSSLRSLDVVVERNPARFDALIAECDREEAVEVAERIHRALDRSGLDGRVGVAAYPGDAPSVDSLLTASSLAMAALPEPGVQEAGESARVIQVGEREIIVAEPAMVRLFGLVERVAVGPMPVLVTGETGSGKDVVAEAIHALGPRASRPIVKLNCAALPENLLESELFGHERGAFTGADAAKPGLFETADRGTLFLDEIGEMSPALQAKLLRVLEDRRVRRVGATREKTVDVRVVAATHRDLKAAVESSTFRQDLYYRLSVMVLSVPPLRERQREIPLLAERVAAEAAERAGREPVTLGAAALEVLQRYDWPGNVRELQNAVGAAVVLCQGDEIAVEDLPVEILEATGAFPAGDASQQVPDSDDGPRMPLDQELRAIEKRRISEALELSGGNQSEAARILGMPRRTFVNKVKSLGIEIPKPGKKGG